MYFQNYELRNISSNKCLKISFSEDPSTSNMVKGPNIVEVSNTPSLSYFFFTVKAIEMQKIALSDMQSLKNVCSYIGC